MTAADGETLLFGTISLDRYLASGAVMPGGGILNMAWRWRRAGRPFRVVTRVGADDGAPVIEFLARHGIPCVAPSITAPGATSRIDIDIRPDRQPWMDNFVPGVWEGLRLEPEEVEAIANAGRVQVVLVEGAIAELERLARRGHLEMPTVSADFLGFRHYTPARFAATMRDVDVGFVGWPGAPDDLDVDALGAVAFDLGRLVVVTAGTRAIRVFDGRSGGRVEHRYPVTAVPIRGTTLGCGDAFIAGFLDELWRSDDLDRSIDAGRRAGAETTAWARPLPDAAYEGGRGDGPRGRG